MNNRGVSITLGAAILAIAFSGCASGPSEDEAPSSVSGTSTTETAEEVEASAQSVAFLPDYSRLQKDPENPNSLLWINPALSGANYSGVIVAPVVFHLDPKLAADGVRPDAETMNQIFDYFHEALVREFGRYFRVTDQPGDGVMRYQAAITGLDTKTDLGDSPLDYLPVMLVARTATGANKVKAVVFMESFYKDSLTGQLLGEVAQSGEGGGSGEVKDVTLDSVRPVLDAWARKAASRTKQALDQANTGSS